MAKVHDGITEQRKAALKRKADAWALHAQGDLHARGAGYLGGYAIECKVKAVAMEVYRCRTLGELVEGRQLSEDLVYSHRLEGLIQHVLPRLYARMRSSNVWRDFAAQVNTWSPNWRYDPRDWNSERARLFLESVDRVFSWLESNRC